MKLYLVHAGFYDENISGGFYESHTNYFIVASDVKEAKLKAKKIPEYKKKKMHIDGIKVIEKVENYRPMSWLQSLYKIYAHECSRQAEQCA